MTVARKGQEVSIGGLLITRGVRNSLGIRHGGLSQRECSVVLKGGVNE